MEGLHWTVTRRRSNLNRALVVFQGAAAPAPAPPPPRPLPLPAPPPAPQQMEPAVPVQAPRFSELPIKKRISSTAAAAQQNEFQCRICGLIYNTRRSLGAHVAHHTRGRNQQLAENADAVASFAAANNYRLVTDNPVALAAYNRYRQDQQQQKPPPPLPQVEEMMALPWHGDEETRVSD